MPEQYGNRQKHLNPNPLQQRLLGRFHHKIIDLIRPIINKEATPTTGPNLLDAGCGEGFVLHYLRQELPLTLSPIGGDFSAEALHWGRANLNPQLPVVNFDIHHLPFADNSFPLVMCLEVLEHLPDSRLGLQELARVSADYILISVPHEPLFRAANFLRGKHIRAWGNDPEHLHNYTGRSFRRMVGSVIDLVWHGYAFPWQIALGRKRRA